MALRLGIAWGCVGVLGSTLIGCTPKDDGGADDSETTGVPTGVTSLTTGMDADESEGTTDETAGDEETGDDTGDDSEDAETTGDDGDTTTTTTTGPMECGNGIVEGLEDCDCGDDDECTETELGNMGCADVTDPVSGNPFDGGTISCTLSCFYNLNECFVCGNAQLDEGEPCDNGEFSAEGTCGAQGFLGGQILCNQDCSLDTSMCTEASWSEDWESGMIGGAFGSAGNAAWEVDGSMPHAGSFSAHSGPITSSQTSGLTMSLTWSGPGAFIFWHKESTESCCDHLQVWVDGAMQAEWSGENDWAEDTVNVTAGTHNIEFRYEKDGSVDTGQDRVWVDDIRSDGAP